MEGALFAADALLASGWARDVLFTWDDEGRLVSVAAGAKPGAAARAPGPVVPGMANVHSHAFQRAMAGLAEARGHPEDDFWTWREAMYRLVAAVGPEDLEAIALQLQVEMLRHGYTAVGEFHYLHHDRDGTPYGDRAELSERIVAAARASGIALTLLPVLYAWGGFGHRPLSAAQRRFAGTPETIAELLRTLAARHLPDPRLRFGAAPHSARAVDALQLTELVAALDGFDATAPIHMHVSEQPAEVRDCLATHGATPGHWLMDIVAVDGRWCLVHGTHLDAGEAARLRAAGATLGLCPTTEANLGDGLFAFDRHFAEGGRWGIGGDSHVCVSPFEELRALEYGQRLRLGVRNVAATDAAPEVATNLWAGAARGGALALGQPAGVLEPGRRADLVALDGGDLDFEGLAPAGALAVATFSGASNRIRDVYVAGERVVAEGRHARAEEAARAFRATLKRLRERRTA